jgi:hypothetical protein
MKTNVNCIWQWQKHIFLLIYYFETNVNTQSTPWCVYKPHILLVQFGDNPFRIYKNVTFL